MTALRIGFALSTALSVAAVAPATVSAQTEKPVSSFRDCKDICPEMATVPAGKFMMGAPRDEGLRPPEPGGSNDHAEDHTPVHAVTIRQGFALGKYPVTRDEFAAFVRETGFKPRSDCKTLSWDKKAFSWTGPGYVQTGRDPVVCVSWYDAQAYVHWLSRKTGHEYRLPTEAQWEYAARAGAHTTYYWGNDWKQACRFANVYDQPLSKQLQAYYDKYYGEKQFRCRDGFDHTSPVGRFLPNSFGLYDTAGNVEQWVQDCWVANYSAAPDDDRALASGKCSLRAVRGGSYDRDLWDIRPAARRPLAPITHDPHIGFRVARLR